MESTWYFQFTMRGSRKQASALFHAILAAAGAIDADISGGYTDADPAWPESEGWVAVVTGTDRKRSDLREVKGD